MLYAGKLRVFYLRIIPDMRDMCVCVCLVRFYVAMKKSEYWFSGYMMTMVHNAGNIHFGMLGGDYNFLWQRHRSLSSETMSSLVPETSEKTSRSNETLKNGDSNEEKKTCSMF